MGSNFIQLQACWSMVLTYYYLIFVLLVFKIAHCSTVEIFQFNNASSVQFQLESSVKGSLSLCLHFRPRFQKNPNHYALLSIKDILLIGIYQDSKSGWVRVHDSELVFEFLEPLFPRRWHSLCVLVGLETMKVWMDGNLIESGELRQKLDLEVKVG